jgi:hypothetical protein
LSSQAAQLSFAPKGYKFRLSSQAAQLSFIYFITAPYADYDMRMLQLFIYDGLGAVNKTTCTTLDTPLRLFMPFYPCGIRKLFLPTV